MTEKMELEFTGMCFAIQQRVEGCAIDVALALQAPHKVYGAKLPKDGNQWCWLYGENLQEGIAGFGDTPRLAAIEFDKAWNTEVVK
jgi:hypothetical protein